MDNSGWTANDQVAIAVARNGEALMAWDGLPPSPETASRLRVRRISPSGELGRIRTLSTAESLDPAHISVALDADGDALVAWAAYDHSAQAWQVWARRLSRSGVVGPLRRLSRPSEPSWLPQAALTPRGKGAVVYDNGLSQILRRITPRSRLGKRIHLTEAGGFGTRLVATRDGDFVTAGRDGNGVVVGYRLRPSDRLLSRRISADTAMQDAVIDIGVNRRGTAYLTYRAADNSGDRHPRLWARTWTRDGTLGPARRVAPRAHSVVRATSRTDLEGDTVISWSRYAGPAKLVLYARIWKRNGTFGPVHRLGLIQANDVLYPVPSPAPNLALDDDGDGMVAWPAEPQFNHVIAWARRIRQDGTVGPKVMLRDNASPQAIGMTRTGRARTGIVTSATLRLLLKTNP